MWYRTCNLQFWWQCPLTFVQNPKTFRINSDSLFGKSSSFYVEYSFTKNCRAFCPESPKAYFAIKFPCTREKKIWQVFRELVAQNPKIFSSYRKILPKFFSGHVKWSFDKSGWNIFVHKVLNYFEQMLKNTSPKLLGWTPAGCSFDNPAENLSLNVRRSFGQSPKKFPRIHTLDT